MNARPALTDEPRRIRGDFPALGHSFGDDMRCVDCTIHWAEHQARPERCDPPSLPPPPPPVLYRPIPPRQPPSTRYPESPLAKARIAANLTQVALAEIIGCGQPSVWRWERGMCRPMLRVQVELARLLGVPRQELFPQ